jgi:hypothetical protein
MINEHDCVVLLQDLSEDGLKLGDIGTVAHIHEAGAGSAHQGLSEGL